MIAPSRTNTIAVLMACHNRRETTLRCLAALRMQALPEGWTIRGLLVDDGSTDRTGQVVAERHPEVVVLHGDGTLFWAKSMRLAWSVAQRDDPDVYVWLNDDVVLDAGGLRLLLATWRECQEGGRPQTIVVGACRDPLSGRHTYGGQTRIDRHPGRLAPVLPQAVAVACDTFQGNCVWVPRSVYLAAGMIDPFSHAMGDTDYGYRARRHGCSIVVAPGYVGTCPRQDDALFDGLGTRPAFERLKRLLGPKGLPVRDWIRFVRRHGGGFWLAYALSPYVRALLGRGYVRRDAQ